ncbi:hypothetical protein [Pseudovibrio sp. Ad26]|uniref:capsular polysaccharide export protein, LipB/KpsS family n=1 Tax=Pseudovibrio sp. Ad26 TaxID=989410 RepID=UPI0007AEBCAE|nr:hypothetical protein [Pseudovibrio sp. Ad26]KZL13851.1 Capsule polysaccharide biosynthesis protein [Pseudovibrio sp. Ad26]
MLFSLKVRRKWRKRLNNWYISYTDPQYFAVKLRLLKRRLNKVAPRQHIILTNVLQWKRRAIAEYFLDNFDQTIHFVENNTSKIDIERFLRDKTEPIVAVWGYGGNKHLLKAAKKKKWEVWRLEDGFIRSVGLGVQYAPLASFILDKTGGLYFDPRVPSQVERILNDTIFSEEQRQFARNCIAEVTSKNITKYNLSENGCKDVKLPDKPLILVFGQFEGDASLKYGGGQFKLNTDLIDLALIENPDAAIIYREHPDITSGLRPSKSDVTPYLDRIQLLPSDYPVWLHLPKFDKVYVITSLAGFEAAIRGAKVRVAGSPFYAGWGITQDLEEHPRRKKARSVEEVFYAAYLKGAIYLNPGTGKTTNFEDTLQYVQAMKRQ